ncbi:MAG: hypothetical protein WA160_03030 [Pseudobdellovibrio sp.]
MSERFKSNSKSTPTARLLLGALGLIVLFAFQNCSSENLDRVQLDNSSLSETIN